MLQFKGILQSNAQMLTFYLQGKHVAIWQICRYHYQIHRVLHTLTQTVCFTFQLQFQLIKKYIILNTLAWIANSIQTKCTLFLVATKISLCLLLIDKSLIALNMYNIIKNPTFVYVLAIILLHYPTSVNVSTLLHPNHLLQTIATQAT